MRKLICTADKTDLWLEERHKRVTGSDAAVLLGLAMYPKNLSKAEKVANLRRTKRELTAQQAKDEFTVDAAKNMRVINFGRVYEQWEARVSSCLLGASQLYHSHGFFENSLFPGLGATLDGLVTFDNTPPPADIPVALADFSDPIMDEVHQQDWETMSSYPGLDEFPHGIGLWEQKTTSQWGMKSWKDGVPGYYMAQVQLQLAVTGLPWAIISCTGDRDRVACLVRPDALMQAELKQAAKEFWA